MKKISPSRGMGGFFGPFHDASAQRRDEVSGHVFLRKRSGKSSRLGGEICQKPCTHRIHGAAIYGNMDPIHIPQSC